MSTAEPYLGAVQEAVTRALAEDLAPLGDLTSALLPAGVTATAQFVPRVDGTLAGTACASEAFRQLDTAVEVQWSATDGDRITAGQVLLHEAHLRTIANHAFGAHYSRMLQRCGQCSFAFQAGHRQLR